MPKAAYCLAGLAGLATVSSLSGLAPAPFAASTTAQLAFERRGHHCWRGLLETDRVDALAETLTTTVATEGTAPRERAKLHALMLNEDEPAPFLQYFNVNQYNDAAADLARSPTLCGAAASLLGCTALRLYQDSIFEKRPGDEATNWHSDLHTAPFDTNDMITAW